MLNIFRSHANNWIMVVVFAVITFVFVFTFGSWGGGNVSGDLPIAATVNGRVVPRTEFTATYANQFQIMKMYQPDYTAEKARDEGLRDRVLDSLISEELLAQAAEERGLRISDEELAEFIEKRFFGKDKPFDPEEYKRIVNGSYQMSPSAFEEQMRRKLLADRLRTALRESVHVSDAELKEAYEARNNRVDLEVIRVDPMFFKDVGKDDPAATAAWADAHQAELQKFYDDHINRYRQPKKVKARHVLAKAEENASEDVKKAARTKIEAAKKRIDGGEDFAKIAEEVSEDSSAKQGGDLGFFGPGAMVKPFEDAAFALKPGEVSGIVESRFGYHVIKVEEVKEPETKELKDVRLEIAAQLRREELQKKAATDAAQGALAEVKKGTSPADVKLPGLVKTPEGGEPPAPGTVDPFAPRYDVTGPFPQSARVIPKVGVAPQVMKAAFALTKESPVHPEVIDVNGRLYVIKLKDRQVADMAKLAEERDRLEDSLASSRQSAVIEQFIEEMKKNARIEKNTALLAGRV